MLDKMELEYRTYTVTHLLAELVALPRNLNLQSPQICPRTRLQPWLPQRRVLYFNSSPATHLARPRCLQPSASPLQIPSLQAIRRAPLFPSFQGVSRASPLRRSLSRLSSSIPRPRCPSTTLVPHQAIVAVRLFPSVLRERLLKSLVSPTRHPAARH